MFRLKNLIIVTNIIILIFAIELFFIFILNYKTEVEMNTCKRIYNKEKDFSSYSPNCKSVIKHWEQSKFVTYETNSAGRRDLDSENSDIKKIAFIGDSFTFGAMVPIEDNYNFYAFNNILKKPFNIHNFGTPAEQLHNIFNKLKTIINDHGLGLLSIFAHLNKIDVFKGQKVQEGQKIGEVGMTGRATGPHLHWGIYLGEVPIDPEIFLK